MSHQGYLILNDSHKGPNVYFFSLEDGFLRYFKSSKCKTLVGELTLSGTKLNVKAQRRQDGIPNSFFVESRQVFVRDRSYTLGAAVRLELSAWNNDDRQEWGRALFSWQRYYWREPCCNADMDSIFDHEMVQCALEAICIDSQSRHMPTKCYPKPRSSLKMRRCSVSDKMSLAPSMGLAVMKQPITYIQKSANALRHSLGLVRPTSAQSTESAGSTSDDSEDTRMSMSGGDVPDISVS